MGPLNRQLTDADERIEHLAVQDLRVLRLRSVPSVGPATAAAFIAAIDEAQRFRPAHQLEAYLGLVPREYSSGETPRRGAITKAGHSRTRWRLIQAAVSSLRRRPAQAEERRTWAGVSPRAAAHKSPSSPAPGASPASAMRCCGMTACSSPSAFGILVPLLRSPPSWTCEPTTP